MAGGQGWNGAAFHALITLTGDPRPHRHSRHLARDPGAPEPHTWACSHPRTWWLYLPRCEGSGVHSAASC